MERLMRYFATLNTARLVLWCYAVWYGINVAMRFDSHPRLWMTSLGLSAIVGLALLLSTRNSSSGTTKLDGWQIFRLFLMPFCVSSFAALVKDKGYLLIFPSTVVDNVIAFGAEALFLVGMWRVRLAWEKKSGGMGGGAAHVENAEHPESLEKDVVA